MTKILLLFFFISFPVWAQIRPSSSSEQSFNLTYRHFQSTQTPRANLMFEVEQGKRFFDKSYTSLKAGSYYSVVPSWRLGGFVQFVNNLRHNNDWNVHNGSWSWKEKDHYYEGIISLVSIHRFNLYLNQLVFEFRHEWNGNINNGQQVYKLRPGLMYFIYSNGAPLLQFYLLNEYYRPLNFNNQQLYERWYYLGMLYHLSEQWKIGPEISYGSHLWRSSNAFVARWPGQSYLNKIDELKIGLNIQSHF